MIPAVTIFSPAGKTRERAPAVENAFFNNPPVVRARAFNHNPTDARRKRE